MNATLSSMHRYYAYFWLGLSVLSVLLTVLMTWDAARHHEETNNSNTVFIIFSFILGSAHYFTAKGANAGKRWGRNLSRFLGFLYCIGIFPMGIVVGYHMFKYANDSWWVSAETISMIDQGLSDKSALVRQAFAERRTDFVLTPEQIERGLTDSNAEVRRAYAQRIDYTPTPEQVERGLSDKTAGVRRNFAKRIDFTPTPEQFELGLTDKVADVRRAFAARADLSPTSEQIERGLLDEARSIRQVFSKWRQKTANA